MPSYVNKEERNRVPISVRLKPDDKALLERNANEAGLECGVAARQILELCINRMRAGADYVDVLHTLKNALKPTVRVQAGRAS